MASYPVFISQYSRDKDHTLPFHWEVVIKVGEDTSGGRPKPIGMVHHLQGSTNGFFYKPEDKVRYESSLNWCGSLRVGTIPANRVGQIAALLEQVETRMNDTAWNCQNWTQLALRKLRASGFDINREVAESLPVLQQSMQDLFTKWDAGDA